MHSAWRRAPTDKRREGPLAQSHVPDNVPALLAVAANHYNRRELRDAERVCARILRRDPAHPDTLRLMGLVAMSGGDSRAAQDWFERAAAARATPELLVDLAAALMTNGELQRAVECCRTALAAMPLYAEAHYNLGTALHWQDNFQGAVASLREAVRLKPDFHPARVNLGRALLGAGEYLEARQELEQLLPQFPSHADALLFCAIACQELGDFDKAIGYYERALSIKPDSVDILGNLANSYRDAGNFPRAAEIFERILVMAPGNTNARNDYSHALLARGEFSRGWELYDARWEANRWIDRSRYTQQEWKEEPLAGKRLLIWGEQGIGDQMMFASMIPGMLEQAGSCTVVCAPKLERLFARSFQAANVVPADSAAHAAVRTEPFDYQVPIGSLAQYFRRGPGDFPRHSGYLRADPGRTRAWAERLAALGGGRKIGISWRGGFVGTRRHLRSVDLEAWLPILRVPGATFVSLQYTDCAAELEALRAGHGITLHHWQEAIDDYDETAALVNALDLVVSVCTAAVHLTGALGKPAWVLVPSVPEWRYLRSGDRMLWYPSIRLLRQERAGEWGAVIGRAAGQLRDLTA